VAGWPALLVTANASTGRMIHPKAYHKSQPLRSWSQPSTPPALAATLDLPQYLAKDSRRPPAELTGLYIIATDF
jgi:hypothetical protein